MEEPMMTRLVTLVATAFFLLFATEASAQSLWVLHHQQPEVFLTEISLPDGKQVQSFRPSLFTRVTDGGLALDKFNNELIACDGTNFFGINLFDLTERQISISGSNPFFVPISGIAVLHGRNGRPKWLFCSSGSEYTYVDMRTWQWANRTWPIPNGGYPVMDIGLAISHFYRFNLDVPVLYAAEFTGPMVVWNPVAAIKGRTTKAVKFFHGTGLYNTQLTNDTNLPQNGLFGSPGTYDMSGTVYGLGILNGALALKDVSGNSGQIIVPQINPSHIIAGIAYSAQIQLASDPVDGIPAFSKSQATLPMNPVHSRITRLYMDNLSGFKKPFIVLSNVPVIHYHTTYSDLLSYINYNKSSYDNSRYFYDLASEPSIVYAQWAFKDHGFRSDNRILFSEAVRVPISNLQ